MTIFFYNFKFVELKSGFLKDGKVCEQREKKYRKMFRKFLFGIIVSLATIIALTILFPLLSSEHFKMFIEVQLPWTK